MPTGHQPVRGLVAKTSTLKANVYPSSLLLLTTHFSLWRFPFLLLSRHSPSSLFLFLWLCRFHSFIFDAQGHASILLTRLHPLSFRDQGQALIRYLINIRELC